MVSFEDRNGDGRMQIRGPAAPDGLENEVVANNDIFVLANPEIAQLPGWVIGLVVAGGMAAALSTAAGLLMVREAGGFVSDLQGKNKMLESGDVVVGNEDAHKYLLQLLKKAATPAQG